MTAALENSLEQQLSAMNEKLDLITGELAAMKRQRRELEELKDDLLLISKDIFQSAAVELEDIAPFVRTGTFRELAKRVLRNADNITKLLEMLEGSINFVEDARPMGKELFNDALERLDHMDRAGVFDLMRQAAKMSEGAAGAYQKMGTEDLEPYSMLQIMKAMGAPEVRKTLTFFLLLMKGMGENHEQ